MSHTNEVERVANAGWDERVLVCRNGELVQTFIIVSNRFVVLVDTLINATTAEQLVRFAEPYIREGRQLLVVNTHADYDHAWGNQIFAGPAAPHPAPIIAHWLCAEQMRAPEVQAYLRRLQAEEPEIFDPVRLTEPTLLFDEELIIVGGDLTMELFATPGHTPDHVALYIPEIDTLLAGDGAELPFPFARSVEDLPTLRYSLQRMAELDAGTVLYCHAPPTIGPRLLQANIAYFDGLEACCRQALARGVPPDPDPEADVVALVGCRYEDLVPADPLWQQVHEWYRNEGHARQIRMMLAYLSGLTDIDLAQESGLSH